jgi:hypothetical protein
MPATTETLLELMGQQGLKEAGNLKETRLTFNTL